jgi:hypothetical protein
MNSYFFVHIILNFNFKINLKENLKYMLVIMYDAIFVCAYK